MGWLDGLLNPTKNTSRGYKKARRGWRSHMNETNPFYRSFLQSGLTANNRLADFLGLNGADAQRAAYDSYMTSPAYDFQFDQGQKALDQSAIARGGLQSGAQLKDLQQFGQGLYAMEMDNYLNRLTGTANSGFLGAEGLGNNQRILGDYQIGLGQSRDAGNQAAAGNIIGIGSTIAGLATGMPLSTGGSAQGQMLSQLFQKRRSPQMPVYDNGRVNPYAQY